MPYTRPTLSDLRGQVAADITTGLQGVDGLLRFSNMQVLGRSLAGLGHLNYGYLDWISRQAVPFTATDEFLEGWAALKGVYRESATPAVLSVTFPGAVGSGISAGAEVVRADSTAYVVLADAMVGAAGTVTVTVTASVPGAAGNADSGTLMSLSASLVGIQSSGVVTSTTIKGTDQEADDSLFARMLFAYQNPPNGGSQADYQAWALAVPGVTRAWCRPNGFGTGTVVVYVMFDSVNAGNDGFPQGSDGISSSDNRVNPGNSAAGDQLAVANGIFPGQPVTPMVYVCAPLQAPVDFTITGLNSASESFRASIVAAIKGVLFSQGSPLGDGSVVDLSDINSAIAAISSTQGFVITSPTANIVNAVGYLPTLGDITYS